MVESAALSAYAAGWVWVIIGIEVAGLIWIPVQIWLAHSGRNVPEYAWWVAPSSAMAVGSGAGGSELSGVIAGANEVSSSGRNLFGPLREHLVSAQTLTAVAALVALILSAGVLLATVLRGSGAGDSEERAYRWGVGIGFAAVGGGGYLSVSAFWSEAVAPHLHWVGAAVVIGGVACAFAASRPESSQDAHEPVWNRWETALAFVSVGWSAAWFSASVTIVEAIRRLEPGGGAPALDRAVQWLRVTESTTTMGYSGFGLTCLIGALTVASAGWRGFQGHLLRRVAVVVLAWLPAGLAVGYYLTRMAPYFDVMTGSG